MNKSRNINTNKNTKLINQSKIIVLVLIIFILILIDMLRYPNKSYSASKLEGIENFPESFKPYLYELKKNHSNWNFIALYTNLDWKYVIDNENVFGKNLVPKSYSDSWKNTKPGEYNVEVDAGWVDCSRDALLYTMDPRNFLNEVRVFQFEELSFDEKINYMEGIEKILYGTEFYNRMVDYLDYNGNVINTSKKYGDLIFNAGRTSKVSSYHLASRIKQEVGPFLSHSSISGNVLGYKGLYNFYNIGATSSAEPMGAIINGLKYARDANGASEERKAKLMIPWNTKERAITGGGIFIGSSYINIGQNTIYLQKFHVDGGNNQNLFWHQYMTNVLAPYSESQSIYKGYKNSNLLDEKINFIIPIYNNMEKIQSESPNIKKEEYDNDNTKVYANVNNELNIRTGPSTSYEKLTTVTRNEKMTRIAKGKQAGERWDRVILENGMIGYAFQNYIEEVPKSQIEEIRLAIDNKVINKGEIKKIGVQILPEEAKEEKIEYKSSNENVAKIDSEGNIYAITSGKSTITVKAVENDVKANIDIEVYSKVTGIELNIEKITLQQGEKYKIISTILPEDASNKEIKYESENQNIAICDEIGTITGINKGKTKINISSKENEVIKKQVEVNVIEKISEQDIKFSGNLKVQGNIITSIDEEERTKQEFLRNIFVSEKYKIRILNKDGIEIEENQLIGTGTKIQILKNSEEQEIITEYIAIIYGDVNGDGKINSIDLLKLQRHILEIESLDKYSQIAGNINKDGRKPTSRDLLLIQRDILGLSKI